MIHCKWIRDIWHSIVYCWWRKIWILEWICHIKPNLPHWDDPKAMLHPWKDCRDGSATSRMERGMVVPTTSPFNSPIWPVQKTSETWRMDVYYFKLNQLDDSDCSYCARCDAFGWTEWHISCTWYTVIDLADAFFSIVSIRAIRNNLLSAGKASNIPSLLHLGFPMTKKEAQCLVGLFGFLRQHISHLGILLQPIHQVT